MKIRVVVVVVVVMKLQLSSKMTCLKIALLRGWDVVEWQNVYLACGGTCSQIPAYPKYFNENK